MLQTDCYSILEVLGFTVLSNITMSSVNEHAIKFCISSGPFAFDNMECLAAFKCISGKKRNSCWDFLNYLLGKLFFLRPTKKIAAFSTVTRVSTIVEFLKNWSTIFSNKNSINCILLHKFSLFYTILAIFHNFFHIFTKKFKLSKNALVTLTTDWPLLWFSLELRALDHNELIIQVVKYRCIEVICHY